VPKQKIHFNDHYKIKEGQQSNSIVAAAKKVLFSTAARRRLATQQT